MTTEYHVFVATDDVAYANAPNPGQSGTTTVSFDIPRAATPEHLVVATDEFDHGVPTFSFDLEAPEWIGEGDVEWQEA